MRLATPNIVPWQLGRSDAFSRSVQGFVLDYIFVPGREDRDWYTPPGKAHVLLLPLDLQRK